MTIGYQERSEASLSWSENRQRIALSGRQLLTRVLNQALAEASREYLAAMHRGDILKLGFTEDELKRLLLKASVKELGSGIDESSAA